MRVMVTGHRLFNSAEQQLFAHSELERLALKLADNYGARVGISGMALGADLWWARAVLDVGMDLWAYIPFEGQADRWSRSDRERYQELRGRAAKEAVLGEGYNAKWFHARNDAMLRDADMVIAVLDPCRKTGGTVTTVAKAQVYGKHIIVVDLATLRTTMRPRSMQPRSSEFGEHSKSSC